MGLACALALEDAGMVTVNLSVDFFGSAGPGQWLEIVGTPGRTGRTISFGTAVATAHGEPIARGSAIFRTTTKEPL
jgi:acyl-coenzyme A thioesterase PaaI-like protein